MTQGTSQAFQEALQFLKSGDSRQASTILAGILAHDPNNERAWHMLSYALTDPQKQAYALERVLQINPDNRAARSQLARLTGPARKPAPQPAPTAQQTIQPPEPKRASPASEPQPQPSSATVAPAPARSGFTPDAWQKRLAAQAPASSSKIILFPGAETRSRITYSRWERFKIRFGLSWRRFKMDWRIFSQSKLAVLGLVLIAIFGIMAVAHPILMKTVWNRAVYDPVTGFDMKVFPHPSTPGPGHLLGTDTLGRDVLSMLLAATTPTFIIGLTAALTTAIVGTFLSVTAAYFRGAPDAIITNMADVFLLLPAPIIMIIIGARFRDLGPVPLGLIYGLVTGAGATVIVMRAHGLQVVSKPYMEAAQIAGGGSWHMIIKHMLPAMMPLAALQMMIAVTGAVVADGFISFFGLTRTTNNWGTLIFDAFVYANIGSSDGGTWHMLIPAALSFSLFALGFYLVSRGLHRVASPTIREERA